MYIGVVAEVGWRQPLSRIEEHDESSPAAEKEHDHNTLLVLPTLLDTCTASIYSHQSAISSTEAKPAQEKDKASDYHETELVLHTECIYMYECSESCQMSCDQRSKQAVPILHILQLYMIMLIPATP